MMAFSRYGCLSLKAKGGHWLMPMTFTSTDPPGVFCPSHLAGSLRIKRDRECLAQPWLKTPIALYGNNSESRKVGSHPSRWPYRSPQTGHSSSQKALDLTL